MSDACSLRREDGLIFVYPLRKGDEVIIPAARLGMEIEVLVDGKKPATVGRHLSEIDPPNLDTLVHAYFGRTGRSDLVEDAWSCPKYREAVASSRGQTEHSCTLLVDRSKLIEAPRLVLRDGLWVFEDGEKEMDEAQDVEIPGNGWVLRYDEETGLPAETSQRKADAESVFGDDASFFYVLGTGIRVLSRTHVSSGHCGPFHLIATYGLNDKPEGCGARRCYYQE